MIADLEDLETLEASDIYSRRIKAQEVLISQKDDEFVFPNRRWNSTVVRKRLRLPSTHSWREQLVRSEDLSGEIQCESEESQPAEPTDDAEARSDFWSIQGDFIYHHHTEHKYNSMCRRKKHSYSTAIH